MSERRTTAREWALAIGGGLALAAVLVSLWGGEAAPVATSPAPTPTPAPAFAAAAVAARPVAAVAIEGFILRGVMLRAGGGAAIIESSDGRQRLVRRGQPVAPGITLAAIEPGAVLLASAGAEARLVLDADQPRVVAAAPPVPGRLLQARPEELAASADSYRLALRPRRSEGRITGYEVRDAGAVPLFRVAALQPGDVIVAVNGQELMSEEKLLELPAEVAGAYGVELAIVRRGQPLMVKVELVR